MYIPITVYTAITLIHVPIPYYSRTVTHQPYIIASVFYCVPNIDQPYSFFGGTRKIEFITHNFESSQWNDFKFSGKSELDPKRSKTVSYDEILILPSVHLYIPIKIDLRLVSWILCNIPTKQRNFTG